MIFAAYGANLLSGGLGKPLFTDLRTRLVAAVASGLSRRAAAERFGVSPASAVRWVQAVNTTGSVEAKPQDGDTRSRRIEAFRDVILAAVQARKDISLVELAELLRNGHGAPAPCGASLTATA